MEWISWASALFAVEMGFEIRLDKATTSVGTWKKRGRIMAGQNCGGAFIGIASIFVTIC